MIYISLCHSQCTNKQTKLTNLMATCSLLYKFFPETRENDSDLIFRGSKLARINHTYWYCPPPLPINYQIYIRLFLSCMFIHETTIELMSVLHILRVFMALHQPLYTCIHYSFTNYSTQLLTVHQVVVNVPWHCFEHANSATLTEHKQHLLILSTCPLLQTY